MSKTRHLVNVTLLIILATAGLYFLFDFMFPLPAPAVIQAGPIDTMFQVHFLMMAFLFALIMVIMLYAVFVFRRQPGDEEDAVHTHGNTTLEIIWTVVPTIVVLIFGVYGVLVFNDIRAEQEGEMVVEVIGRQWSWSFAYPEFDGAAAGELVLPVNRPVLLHMESEDVLHAFWVPEFRVKQDLMPGRVTELRFTPTVEGNYKLRCAEICGLDHAGMLADVRVVSQAEFDSFIEAARDEPAWAELTPEERGEIWYGTERGYGCVACHSLDGSPGVGPSWLGIYMAERPLADGTTVIGDEAYMRLSILEPDADIVAGYQPGIMPANYGERFEARQAELMASQGIEIDIIDDLIAFIRTLEE
jgi:cytochrome c oxidase subunit II